MERIAILLCAGRAQRMGFNKLTESLAGKNAILRSMEALLNAGADGFVFAVNEETRSAVEALCCPVPRVIVRGGQTRGASVLAALAAAETLASKPEDAIAIIHDAARCLVSPETVRACVRSAAEKGSGIAAVPVTDTVFRVGETEATLIPREGLWRMQTPQVFPLVGILAAYRSGGVNATDDATIWMNAGHTPVFVAADENNFKLTTAMDWTRAERLLTRCGTGYDTHVLTEGRRLILGGVDIPFEKGLLGHSDADVLVHAVMDAILGAAAMPDIGHLFPDTDERYRGADSMALLREVIRRVGEKGLRVNNIDATIIAQRPKMAPYIDAMRNNVAKACGTEPENVGIKATTTEHMNDEGRGLCISAQAVATLI